MYEICDCGGGQDIDMRGQKHVYHLLSIICDDFRFDFSGFLDLTHNFFAHFEF